MTQYEKNEEKMSTISAFKDYHDTVRMGQE